VSSSRRRGSSESGSKKIESSGLGSRPNLSRKRRAWLSIISRNCSCCVSRPATDRPSGVPDRLAFSAYHSYPSTQPARPVFTALPRPRPVWSDLDIRHRSDLPSKRRAASALGSTSPAVHSTPRVRAVVSRVHGTRHTCGTDRLERGSQPEPDGLALPDMLGKRKVSSRSSGDRASVS
jgi:hypothetical protein